MHVSTQAADRPLTPRANGTQTFDTHLALYISRSRRGWSCGGNPVGGWAWAALDDSTTLLLGRWNVLASLHATMFRLGRATPRRHLRHATRSSTLYTVLTPQGT